MVNASAIPGSPPAAKAVLGTGALQNTLVFGAAIRGTGSAPAADVTIGAGGEVARFKLALVPAGGKGVVFDGATAAGAANYVSRIQDAQGKTQNSIAIGKLEVQ